VDKRFAPLKADVHHRAAIQLLKKFEPLICRQILFHITGTGEMAEVPAPEIAFVCDLKIYGLRGLASRSWLFIPYSSQNSNRINANYPYKSIIKGVLEDLRSLIYSQECILTN
jgi:hypothetical protein